jgi:hypothetical protein
MGPVEKAIRARFRAVPTTLYTFGQQKPFELSVIDRDGIVLRLGKGGWTTPLTWECLESIATFLGRHGGWVRAGGIHSVDGEPGTLDEHLKKYQKRDVARWLVRVLADAGVVDVSAGPPLSVRLHQTSAGRASMSLLRKLRGGGRESPPQTAAAATSEEWKPGQFARASSERIEVRFHDAAEAKLATEQLRDLKTEWQGKRGELAAAKAEETAKHAAMANEMAKHAAIVNEIANRQTKVEIFLRRIDGVIAQVEAYALRKP